MKHKRSLLGIAMATIVLVSMVAVCATSVSGTGPTAASWGPTRQDVFVKGSDGALWQIFYTFGEGGHWSSWDSHGGYLTSSPAAVARAVGEMDVFARGSDGALWWYRYAAHHWTPLGGYIAPGTGPAVASWSENRLDVFVVGTDGALWHRYWNGAVWSGWGSLGGYLTTSPAAISIEPNRWDVYARASDGALYIIDAHGSTLGDWTPLSAPGIIAPGTGPGVSSWSADRIDVFVQATTGALYHTWWIGSGPYHSLEPLGGYLTSSPAAISKESGHISVFVRDSTGALSFRSFYDGYWHDWGRVGGYIAAT